MFYKLQEQGKEQIARDEAQLELQLFHQRVGKRLHKVYDRERTSLLSAQKKRFELCLREKRRPSLLCTAMAARDDALCAELLQDAQRKTCLKVVPAANALAATDVGECSKLPVPDLRELCGFVVSGEFHCGRLSTGDLIAACEAAAAIHAGKSLKASDMPPGQRAVFSWLMAILKHDVAWCDVNPFSAYRGACHALVTRDASACPLVRPTVEHFDKDYSCRDVVAYQAIHNVSEGTELFAILAAAFPGQAKCTLKVHLLVAGKAETREIGKVQVDQEHWKEFRHRMEKNELVDRLEVSCTWDPKSSRFWVRADSTDDW